MTHPTHPWHAHVYFEPEGRSTAAQLHRQLLDMLSGGTLPDLVHVGAMRDRGVGPHPIPQFEVQFLAAARPAIVTLIQATGLTALVHPVTDDDLADHTTLAQWIGEPLTLDLTVLDPPGHNQGLERFGKVEF